MTEAGSTAVIRWIVLLPLAGAAVNLLAGAWLQRRLGRSWIAWIACAPVALSFVAALEVWQQLAAVPPEARLLVDRLLPWLQVGALQVDIAFQADPLSVLMALIVTGVGGLIHLYSVGYMDEEPALWRYFGFLNLFTFAMLVLVLADNLLLLFVGWEGVGLCSYALIGFWYRDWNNASAGTKAFLVNRIGDFGFLLGTLLLFWSLADLGHPTLVFRELAEHAHLLETDTVLGLGTATVVTLLLFVGATGKSAQIPLYVWLPDAMAGPTPVSALIHAATMVTAGVYMIARLGFLYSMAPLTLDVVATVGALTALFAATIGTAQTDIKKVLAYSTVSQLGYMFLAMGSGAYAAGIFHLTTHAFFKACLFLGAGSVIHALHHEQDMRRMGGLRRWMPWTYATFLISTLAIAGFPPLSGFFSKDEILWRTFSSGHVVLWGIGLLAAGLTAFYMFRQVFLTFHGESRVDPHVREHLHESPRVMTIPLAVLAALALIGGGLGVPQALGGNNRLEQWLAPVFHAHGAGHGAHAGHGAPALEYVLMVASVAVAAAGFWVARQMYLTGHWSPERVASLWGGRIYRAVWNKYYVDELYQAVFVRGTLALSSGLARFDLVVIDGLVNLSAAVTRLASRIGGWIDLAVVDGAVNAVAAVTGFVGGRLRRVQTGTVNAYLFAVVAGLAVIAAVRLM